jgi:hypothetical protein
MWAKVIAFLISLINDRLNVILGGKSLWCLLFFKGNVHVTCSQSVSGNLSREVQRVTWKAYDIPPCQNVSIPGLCNQSLSLILLFLSGRLAKSQFGGIDSS